jgi:tetratricopeptide (TPR) repeat protein
MYRDALELDPLNAEAILRLGFALAEQEKFAEAFAALKRAREFGADGIELLIAMGRCAVGLERGATAIAYYEEALKIEPRNFVARRALGALGRKPATPGKESAAVRSGRD